MALQRAEVKRSRWSDISEIKLHKKWELNKIQQQFILNQ